MISVRLCACALGTCGSYGTVKKDDNQKKETAMLFLSLPRRAGTCLLSLVILCSPVFAQTLVNGGLESGESAVPDGWRYGCSGGCVGTFAVDKEVKAEGTRSVRMSSSSEFAPHVFCGLSQPLTNLTPGQVYRLSFQARGEGVGDCWFGGGPEWHLRKPFPSGSFDWQSFHIEWTCGDDTSFEFRVNLDSATQALWVDDVRLDAMTHDSPIVTDLLAGISRLEEQAKALRGMLEQTISQGIAAWYPRADIAIAERFCSYARDDVANGRFERAEEVAREVEELLNRAEKEMKDNVDVPLLKKDAPIEIRDGSLWANCVSRNGEEMRPVFLTGYGHFSPVVDDLPLFPEISINVIQIEIGPRSTVFEDGIRTDEVRDNISSALDRARENGVRVCVLISPHYFPQWALDKWPQLHVETRGFLSVAPDAPEVRDIYRQHIQALVPLIKDHPALHSICLSNEPVSLAWQRDPYRLPLWHAWLERKYITIAALNEVYGTSHGSFGEVPHPGLSFDEQRGPLYDGVRFNQEAFAEFHAWMTGEIHNIAPNLPCHAKVMILPMDRSTVFWGTDPWDFAKLSQLNGNDCPNMRLAPGREWTNEWLGQNMYYDLQRSMKRVPIFNTENHIIRDREKNYIPPEHIYTAIWQGAIHGQGASTTWAWQRTYDAKSDFEGLILHRAACTAAMSRCALDLMRLSKEVAALQNLTPSIAILYSNAALVADPRHVSDRAHIYEALNFCGLPVGFITDEQIEAGLLDQYKCLFVAGAKASTARAIETMRQWAEAGGRIVAYDTDTLVEDEYGRPATPPAFAASLPVRAADDLPQMRDEILGLLNANNIGPEQVLQTEEGGIPYGVEWRTVTMDGKTIINIINYRPVPMKVQLPEGAWKNLMTNQPIEMTVTLAPETPLLVSRE